MANPAKQARITPRTGRAPKVARALPPRPAGFKLPPRGVPYLPKSAAEERATRAYRHAKLLHELEALRDVPDDELDDLVIPRLSLRAPKW